MSKLTEELKSEHQKIVEVLSKAKEMTVDSEEAKKTLLSAREGLLAHLKKEDEFLYPPLRKAAENNESLQRILEIFAKDMEVISKFTMEFFEKYSRGGSDIEFAKDFGKLFAALGDRIRKEEDILYPEYDKLGL